MKPTIEEMVERYDRGTLSRRELIQGLALLAAAGRTAAAGESALIAAGVDHVSIRVRDLERSAAFYQSLYGLTPLGADKEHNILRLGRKRVIVSLRQDEPHGMIDHFGLSIEHFDRESTTKTLQQRGLEPREDWEYGYHVRDPDGVYVQML